MRWVQRHCLLGVWVECRCKFLQMESRHNDHSSSIVRLALCLEVSRTWVDDLGQEVPCRSVRHLQGRACRSDHGSCQCDRGLHNAICTSIFDLLALGDLGGHEVFDFESSVQKTDHVGCKRAVTFQGMLFDAHESDALVLASKHVVGSGQIRLFEQGALIGLVCFEHDSALDQLLDIPSLVLTPELRGRMLVTA